MMLGSGDSRLENMSALNRLIFISMRSPIAKSGFAFAAGVEGMRCHAASSTLMTVLALRGH